MNPFSLLRFSQEPSAHHALLHVILIALRLICTPQSCLSRLCLATTSSKHLVCNAVALAVRRIVGPSRLKPQRDGLRRYLAAPPSPHGRGLIISPHSQFSLMPARLCTRERKHRQWLLSFLRLRGASSPLPDSHDLHGKILAAATYHLYRFRFSHNTQLRNAHLARARSEVEQDTL